MPLAAQDWSLLHPSRAYNYGFPGSNEIVATIKVDSMAGQGEDSIVSII